MSSSRNRLIAAVIAGSIVGIAGCAAVEPSISKEEFIERANAICEAGSAEIEATEIPAGSSPEEAGEIYIDEIVPNIRQQLDDIRALGFPSGDEEELASILDDTAAVLDDIVAAGPAEVGSDWSIFSTINQRMYAYGLDSCAG